MTASLPRLLLCWPAACAPAAPGGIADDVQRYAEAVELVATDAAAAAAACGAIGDPDLRGDCRTQAATALAATDPDAASTVCRTIDGALHREECWFRVAERLGDAALCARAGAFADDCRLHVLSHDLRRLLPKGTDPAGAEALLESVFEGYGFADDDPRPWSAAFRWVLGGQRPLDPATCAAVRHPDRAEACTQTAAAVYSDRLNHARDTGRFPCDAAPGDQDALPESLRFTESAALDAMLASRWTGDLCP